MKFSLWLGRILFGGYFLFSGLNHFVHMQNLAGYAAAKGVPMPELAVAVSGSLIVLGGLSVLLGFMPRVGLTLIILFLVPVTLIMHNFWAAPNAQQQMADMVNFLKNVGLLGACFAMIALPVPWPGSVMARKQSRIAPPKVDWLTGRRLPQ